MYGGRVWGPLCSFYSTPGKYVLFQMCVECDVCVAAYVACACLYVGLSGSNRSCECEDIAGFGFKHAVPSSVYECISTQK